MIIKFTNKQSWINLFKNYCSYNRPIVVVPSNFQTKSKIYKQFPVPWQSVPVFGPDGGVFNVIKENESLVYDNNLCGYCGIEISKNDNVVRWNKIDEKPTHIGPRVFSDYLPLHIKCMKNARIFCPHMRLRPESEFEYGPFYILKNKVIEDLKKFDK